MEIFEYRGNLFEYEITGTGIPFVFLHGLGGSTKQIEGTYLPIEGVRLINMNQQGHGHSTADWEKLDFDRMGEDVIALLDHLEIEKAVFAGISMGAAVALNVAVRFPERVKKLVLIRNAWIDRPMTEERSRAYEDLGYCLCRGGFEAFRETEGWQIVKGPSAYTRTAFTLPFKEEFNVKNWQKFVILPQKQPIPKEDDLSGINIPTMIVACRGDFCHPYEYGEWLRDRISGALLYEIPNKDEDAAMHKKRINEILRMVLL